MPEGLGVELDPSTWDVPEIISFIQKQGNISEKERYGVLHMGVGMALVVCQGDVDEILTILEECGEDVSIIGKVVAEEGDHCACVLREEHELPCLLVEQDLI